MRLAKFPARSAGVTGIAIVLSMVIVVFIVFYGYVAEPATSGWVGVAEKTVWDWLQLLIVPVVIAAGGVWFNRQQRERELEIAEQRAHTDRQIADHIRQNDMLQSYLDQMGQLLLDEKNPLRKSRENDEVRLLARARTLMILRNLQGRRKMSVLQFLYEADLLGKSRDNIVGYREFGPAVISLFHADLKGADMRSVDLSGADLNGANLRDAKLRDIDLSRSNLSRTILNGADLRSADLYNTDFSKANLVKGNLNGADLSNTKLDSADMRNANLSDTNLLYANLRAAKMVEANLNNADLSAADFTDADLSDASLHGAIGITPTGVEQLAQQAKSLKGATMPNGQKYEEWVKNSENGGS